MATLIINNEEVQLGNNKVVLSKSAYPLNDWNFRTVQFSERVNIPYVPFIEFKKYYDFKYKDNGQIVFNGTAMLMEKFNDMTMDVVLLDQSVKLFALMNNKLTVLELDSEDFIFNSSEYSNKKELNDSIWTWSADSTHENRILANNIQSGNLAFSRPYFSIKRLLEKIFDVDKWSYVLSENANLLDKLIISSNHKQFYFTSFEKIVSIDSNISGTYNIDISTPEFLKTDTLTGLYTLNLTYDSVLRIRGFIEVSNDCILQLNGLSSSSTDTLIETFILNKGRFYYDITSSEFATDDTTFNVTFNVLGNADVIFEDVYVYSLIEEQKFGNISLANFVDFKVKTYDNVPDISQKDLFKNCLTLIGGFLTTDNLRKQIKINSLNELFRLNSYDWSSKFVENSEKETSLTGYAKTNYLLFNNSDSKPFNQGRGVFEIVNETLNDSNEIYTSIFEASGEVEINSNLISDNVIYNDIERLNEFNALIGYYETITNYTIVKFDLLNWNNILTNYYDNFIRAIQKGSIIEANFILNKSDYFNFDFTKLVYINQLKATYYVLNIDSYIENEETKLILLKA